MHHYKDNSGIRGLTEYRWLRLLGDLSVER